MSAEIVELSKKPRLTDIVGQLRALADRIEAGEYGEVDSLFALMPREGKFPTLFGWGDVEGMNEPMIQLDLCKMWLLTNIVQRL